MFKRKPKIPSEEIERFDSLRAVPLSLPRETPLMPVLEVSRFFIRAMHQMEKIKTLPAGTLIEFVDVKMKAARPWYFVRVKDSLVCGWINSIILNGGVS